MTLVPRELAHLIAPERRARRRDFRFNALSLLVLGAAAGVGIAVSAAGGLIMTPEQIGGLVFGIIVLAVLESLFPFWLLAPVVIGVTGLMLYAAFDEGFLPLFGILSAGILVMPVPQLAHQWEKAVIFRLGKFHKLRGPGLFLIIPIVDRAAQFIDTRIRVVEFRHETTLTRDSVPVSVDAIAFWMIWDCEKVTLEVENYSDAVTLAAHAALRNAIGKHDLASLLSEQESLGKEIQEFLDAKTNPWGVTILSIGITDIIISKELENALSQQAQAERERQARLILGEAEVEVAKKYVEASRQSYADNPTALQLRGMNMIYESIRRNGSVVLLPSGAVLDMALGKITDDAAKGRKPLEGLKTSGEGS